MTRPEAMIAQRDSVSVSMDGNGYDTNNSSMASKRSNRRRISQFALLDHVDYGWYTILRHTLCYIVLQNHISHH